MNDDFAEFAGWSLAALLVAAVVLVPLFWLSSTACGKRAGMMGLEHSWGPLQGCMVKVGPRYAPIGFIRIVDDKVIIQGDGS